MPQHQQYGAIGHKSVPRFERYPRSVSLECADRAKSSLGRSLKFSNIDTTGGFLADYADTGPCYKSHEFYVDGNLYDGDEAHFGVIVIQANQKPF